MAKVGRPKKDQNAPKEEPVNRPVLAESRFTGSVGRGLFLTVSQVYLHKGEGEEKSEYRFEIKSEPVGASGTKIFQVPVAAINCLRNALYSYFCCEEGMYECRVVMRQDEVRVWLGEWKESGWGNWKGILCLMLPIGATNPIAWLDQVLATIEESHSNTTVVKALSGSSANLDETNRVVGAQAN